ncbi:MAG: sugar phosphate isomerase/epimerase [Gammaproteobacteria bacterium]|nr:sugar phosphate isomerase/epimerase [Gammaproteobacteria bacterium]MDH5304636.1 sugar phosphate isomerase/epimerase [Gammaproteobacteria bacterium]MDH5322507.1 sugar phosphate isomerase/epimerase [Gammaproteobacteria bacterium]
MDNKITRRSVLTGAAGLAAGAAVSTSGAWTLPDAGGAAYLSQWSPPDNVKRDLTPGPTAIRMACAGHRLSNVDANPAEQVEGIRKLGYTAVEAFHVGWRMMNDVEVRELKAALKQYDLWFYNIHVWDNIIHPDPELRAACHREYLRAIEMAEQMDIDFILVHTGSRGPGKPSFAHPQNWTEETWKMSVDAMKKVLADSSGSKVRLAVEAINSNNLNTPAAHVRLRDDVGSDRLKATLDPTNMVHPGTLFRSAELYNQCFELLGEDILYAHAKDIRWAEMLPGLEWVIPGQGEMDYEVYLTHLSRLAYPRPLMMEFLNRGSGYDGPDQYPQAKQFIEDTATRLGVKIYA